MAALLKQKWHYILIIFLGIILRVMFYSYERPLWHDECALALNLDNWGFINIFVPLKHSQAAPVLFLLVSKLSLVSALYAEFCLRFFPLISGVLSIFAFYFLAKKVFQKESSVFLALILFAFNYRLIYYSQEFKQYSSDVFVFVLILLSYFYLDMEKRTKLQAFLIGLVYSLIIWFSYTSLFAMFSVFFILVLKHLKEYKKIILMALPVFFSFLFFYIAQRHLSSNDFLYDYWAKGFLNKNFSNLLSLFYEYFKYSFGSKFIMFAFLAGIIMKLRHIKQEGTLIIFVPLFLAVILSYFSIYPLHSRVSLYLIPVIILFVAQIFDSVQLKNKFLNYAIYSTIILILCASNVCRCAKNIVLKNYLKEDTVKFLTLAKNQMKDGDILYIPIGSFMGYEYYGGKFTNLKNVVTEEEYMINNDEYCKYLNELEKGKTYYYVFTHFPNKRKRLESVYGWAKDKKDFEIYSDKDNNALIVFSL